MPSTTSKYCVSFLPRSQEELFSGLESLGHSDYLELRLDRLPEVDFKQIRLRTASKLIVTIRERQEGGQWEGDLPTKITLYRRALDAGMEFVDLEYDLLIKKRLSLPFDASRHLVLSHHTGERNLSPLQETLRKMFQVPAAVYKLVFRAETLNDNLTALQLQDFARQSGHRYVIHAMGTAGQLSRILGYLAGNTWTYVAADAQSATAPGQLSWWAAREIYALHRKRPGTKLLGLLGYPTRQSKGWLLHNLLIEQKKSVAPSDRKAASDFLYLNFETPDVENFWKNWEKRLQGCSVTIPHKEKIIPFLGNVSGEVKESGVCNTAVKETNGWVGYNTDLLALKSLLLPHREMLKAGVLIIGTGATARSAIAALQQLKINKIHLTGRNIQRGKILAERFQVQFVLPNSLSKLSVGGIIQTTPVGMVPNVEEMPPGSVLFRPGMMVFDAVYNPAITRFLRVAKQRGCRIISGEKMFLKQAALQIKLFTGWEVSEEEVLAIWNKIQGMENRI